MCWQTIILYVLVYQGIALACFAQHSIEICSDNDAYLLNLEDRYYTNGLLFTYRHTRAQAQGRKQLWELSVGQAIYNPTSAYQYVLEEIDRPFAGWLFASFKRSFFRCNEVYHSLGITLGTIGKASGGEAVQVFYHRLVGFDRPQGWQWQVGNEMGVNLTGEYLRGFALNPRLRWADVYVGAQASVGNTFTHAQAQVGGRVGKLLPLAQSLLRQARQVADAKEWGLAFSLHTRWVGYNATIQGGWWQDNNPITFVPQRWLLGTQLGVFGAWAGFAAQLDYVFEYPEIRGIGQTAYGKIRLTRYF